MVIIIYTDYIPGEYLRYLRKRNEFLESEEARRVLHDDQKEVDNMLEYHF